MKWLWSSAAALVVIMSRKAYDYFAAGEFGPWFDLMSPVLLTKLDMFRDLWGSPVIVSGAVGGVGRNDGPFGASQHNVDRWGEVRGIDVFPQVPDGNGGYKYMTSIVDRERALRIAREVGFTGIGIYTDTSPGNMLHLDVREDRTEYVPALWSRVGGEYLGISQGLV
ncbi:hypothetical protein JYT97_03840 [Haliea sp. AH-315-K21]|uniref:Peptidase M15A C-terminal domain-containing protein n=1 Tax=SAR86 cluster bacterium TaxID=2030880 RepID=A0A2A5CF13_9GAMM|nr:hypothetical protein [Haliea sp. AH-315-K21]PCJ42085.1 MAG: hypothetical protein COA71_05700 [SAR86 cluster bacterium]